MANNQKDVAIDTIPHDSQGNQQQKKGFEQGNGNNSTTADPKMRNEDAHSKAKEYIGSIIQGGSPSKDQPVAANQDSKNVNPGQEEQDDKLPIGEEDDDDTATVDEEDVDKPKKHGPEIDGPYQGPDKTEKKVRK